MNRALLVATLAFAQASYAQISEALSDRLEARGLRQEARMLGREMRVTAEAEAAPPALSWDISIGAAYTDAEDKSKTWTTPFVIKAIFNEKIDTLKLAGDGYTSTKADDGTRSRGFSDLDVALIHTLYRKKENDRITKFSVQAGYVMPTHGEVGSSKGKEKIGASYLAPLVGAWDGLVTVKLSRQDADPKPGASRYGRSVLAQATYTYPDTSDVLFQFLRTYRPGAGGTTQVTAAYEFPITSKGKDGWIMSINLIRGLSTGGRDNTIEVDFSLSF